MSNSNRFRRHLTIMILAAVVFLGKNGLCQQADSSNFKRLNPTGALIRSALVPGWGQLYNKKYIKAGIFAIGESYLIYGIITNWRKADEHKRNFQNSIDQVYKAQEFAEYEKYRDRRNLDLWIMAAVVFYSMFDAYVDAHLADFNQTDKAFEARVLPTPNKGISLVVELRIK